LWVLLVVLVIALVVIGVFVARMVANGGTPTQNPRGVTSAQHSTEVPGAAGEVQIDPKQYVNRSARDVSAELAAAGLAVDVRNQFDNPPRHPETCVVQDVSPHDRVRVGASVKVTCLEQG
jgi:hypothetical protein